MSLLQGIMLIGWIVVAWALTKGVLEHWRYAIFGYWGEVCPKYKADPSSTWGLYCYCGYDPDIHER